MKVLTGVNFSIAKGEAVTIIGASGGGKSILLKHLIGLICPDEGEVRVADTNIAGLDERELLKVRRKFGMLFQSAALFDSLTVEENIGFILNRERTFPPDEIAKRVAQVLGIPVVALAGLRKKWPSELSGAVCEKEVGWPVGDHLSYRKSFFTTSQQPAWTRLRRTRSIN